MRGFPHIDEPEKTMRVELWVGVTPERVEPDEADPDEKRSRGL